MMMLVGLVDLQARAEGNQRPAGDFTPNAPLRKGKQKEQIGADVPL